MIEEIDLKLKEAWEKRDPYYMSKHYQLRKSVYE
jgi:hypothetical protein